MLVSMLSVDLRIERAQRLLHMIEQDAPLLALRVAPLSRECQQSAKMYALNLAEVTRAELQRLKNEKSIAELGERSPQGAD